MPTDHPGARDAEGASAPLALDRRAFVGAAAAGALGLALGGKAHAEGPKPRPTGSPRNVIFMVSDGMSIGALQLADRVHEIEHDGAPSRWMTLMADPASTTGLVSTYADRSEVTDSAAASSAWSTGRRYLLRRLNIDTNDVAYEPIFSRCDERGLARGLVSTARLTHATPAGFLVNHRNRNAEREIATQMLERGCDVMLGGGGGYLTPKLLDQFGLGASVLRDASQLAAFNAESEGPMIGVFSESHMAYELDRSLTAEPSLAEMSRAALARLGHTVERTDRGFLLQIEAARVDHAAHVNDIGSVVRDQLVFDETIGAVLDWMSGRDDTLLIVTTDHGNASPSLTVYHERGLEGLTRAMTAERSFEWLMEELKGPDGRFAPERVVQAGALIRRATGIELAREELATLGRALGGQPVAPADLRDAPPLVLASLLSNHTGINFVSGNHTAEYVVQTAIGPGADQLPTFGHLTDTHDVVAGLLDLPPARAL